MVLRAHLGRLLERHETGGRRRGVRALRPGLPGLLRRRGRLDDDGNLVYGYDVGDRHLVALHFYCEALPPPRHLQWLRR